MLTLKNERNCILKIIALVMLFFGNNVFLSFATDSYCTLSWGFHEAGIDMATRNGRPIIGLVYELHHLSGLSNISFYYISSVFALLFLSTSIWIYQQILKKYVFNENICILLSFAGIANILIVEYFMFIEKCGFMLAVLFNVIGVYWLERCFSVKKKRCLGLTIIAITLAIFTYQGTIALFVILSVPFAMKNSENFKDYLLNGLEIGASYIVPVIVDLLAFKFIFKSSRFSDKTDYITTLKMVIKGLRIKGISTFDILPPFLYLLIAFVIFMLVITQSVISKKCVWKIFNAFVIVLAACIFSTAPVLQGSDWVMRAVYPIASIAAGLAIEFFVTREISMDEQKRNCVQAGGYIVMASIIVLLSFQYFSFNKIYVDKYRLNALDQYRYQYIYQEICNYQESADVEVKKIAFYTDSEMLLPQYSNLHITGDCVVSAFTRNWSDIEAMNYYLQTSYEKIEPIEKYTTYFAQKDWNSLSREQLIFQGDTLHVCVY